MVVIVVIVVVVFVKKKIKSKNFLIQKQSISKKVLYLQKKWVKKRLGPKKFRLKKILVQKN